MTRHRSARLAVLAAVVALTAAACGSDSKSSSTQAPATSAAATTAAPSSAAPTTAAATTTAASSVTTASSAAGLEVDLVDTQYGKVLASGGKTLYAFEPDNAGAPTCAGQCAANWPPLKATGAVTPGAGLDAEDFATGKNPDGFDQVTFYKWPLYFFGGDTKPGDVNGQGVGTKWWVVGADGTPIKTAPGGATGAATTTAGGGAAAAGLSVELADTKYGKVLASGGKTLYAFQPDNAGTPTCAGQCAANWPPLKATGAVTPGAGLDADDFATSANPDGFDQVTFYKWPLYFFAGDTKPGDVNGQGVGTKWWVVGADGAPIMTPPS